MPPPDTAPAVQTGPNGPAWGGWRVGVRGTHPSVASSTSCLIPLPSNTASCEAPASNTALKPKVASCLAWGQLTWGQRRLRGCRSTPEPRRELALTCTAPSPRLCTTCWSPRRVSVQVSGRTLMWGVDGDTEVSLHGDPEQPCCDLASRRKVPAASLPSPFVSPYLNTTLRRVSLPSTGRSRSSPGLLWGTEGSRVVGAPRLGGSARGHPGGLG